MEVDIYIRERSGTREIRVPWLPDEIKFSVGGIETASYKIINKGEVAIPTGTDLANFAWDSVWPGEYRTDKSLMRGPWKDPKTYHNILADWLVKGTKLNIMVTGYPINKNVYLKKYEATAAGGFGDMAYSLEFVEDRELNVTWTNTTSTKRPSSTSSTTKYTIKKGDTLWSIAQKYYSDGSKWETIYKANKSIIESTAKSRGYKSSSNGRWIFPGVTLTIPR